jgi:hypothetical protein
MESEMKTFFAASVLVFAVTMSPPGFAEQPYPHTPLPPEANNPAVRDAWAICRPDIAELCPEVLPGGGRIVRCLVAHLDQVTPQCREGMFRAKRRLGTETWVQK